MSILAELAEGLEFEDDAGGYFGAVLVNAEVACTKHVRLEAVAEAMMGRHQVYAAAQLVGERAFSTEGSLRREVCESDETMGEDFQAAREGIAETRTSATEESPRTITRQSAVCPHQLTVKPNPVPVKPDYRSVHAILIYRGAGHYVGPQEGVTNVTLPAIIFENPLDTLGFRNGSWGRGKERRVRKNPRHEDILGDWSGGNRPAKGRGCERVRRKIHLRARTRSGHANNSK